MAGKKKQFGRFRGLFTNIKSKPQKLGKYGVSFIDRKPLISFFIILGVLFLLIVAGSFLRKPSKEQVVEKTTKQVEIYRVGSAPKISVQAKIEKTGVVKIVAQSSGIVSTINVTEGQTVAQGTTLISLASNYSGGNAPSLQRQLSSLQYQNIKNSYDTQKEIIQKQRDLANKQSDNTEQLRKITNDSLDSTRSLLNLNNDILSSIDSNLTTLQNTNTGGVNDAAILSTKQLKGQYQSAVNTINSALKNSEYSTNTDNPPTQLANITKDIALRQLDLQEKSLKLSLETSSVQLRLAQVQEAIMFPAAPFTGVIERVYVNPGQSVSPGTPLLLIHGAQTLKAVASIPKTISENVSLIEPSIIHFPKKNLEIIPLYVSTEATEGNLNSAIYAIPDEYQNDLNNDSFIQIDIPMGYANTGITVPFLPLDAVHQTQDSSYVFVNEKGIAKSHKVEVGPIQGEYIQIVDGLSDQDEIIISRNVINGDSIRKN